MHPVVGHVLQPIGGNDYFRILTDTTTTGPTRFYRIMATSP